MSGHFDTTKRWKDPAARAKIHLALLDGDQSTHGFVRETMRARAPGWKVDSYFTTEEALQNIPRYPPTVLLMDCFLPDSSGIDCTRKLKIFLPNLPIIVLTTCCDTQGILLSLIAGASGYLVWPVQAEYLAHAVTGAAQGTITLCPEAQRAIVSCLHLIGTRSSVTALSPREQQIMALLFERFPDKAIAESLNIAPGTVHVHLAKVFKKLGAHDRHEAVSKFLRL